MTGQGTLGRQVFSKYQLTTAAALSKVEGTAVTGFQREISYRSEKGVCVPVKFGLSPLSWEKKMFCRVINFLLHHLFFQKSHSKV